MLLHLCFGSSSTIGFPITVFGTVSVGLSFAVSIAIALNFRSAGSIEDGSKDFDSRIGQLLLIAQFDFPIPSSRTYHHDCAVTNFAQHNRITAGGKGRRIKDDGIEAFKVGLKYFGLSVRV